MKTKTFFEKIEKEIKDSQKNIQKALFLTVKLGDQDLVSEMIRRGADINSADENGKTPLEIALAEDHKKLAKFLFFESENIGMLDKLKKAKISFHRYEKKIIGKLKRVQRQYKKKDTK